MGHKCHHKGPYKREAEDALTPQAHILQAEECLKLLGSGRGKEHIVP